MQSRTSSNASTSSSYRPCGRSASHDTVNAETSTESRRPPALSPAALEVLTIIAYRQPVTRAFIDQLRGVDSSNTVSSLAEKGLIEEAGRLDVPGKPMLFRTTAQFLRSFSLASIEDLPALPALEENEQMELNMDGTLHETPPGEQLRFLNGEPVPPETE